MLTITVLFNLIQLNYIFNEIFWTSESFSGHRQTASEIACSNHTHYI